MIGHDAAVLDHADAGLAQPLRRLAVVDPELHPDRPQPRLEQDLVDVADHVLGGAEQVHDVDVRLDRAVGAAGPPKVVSSFGFTGTIR